MFNLHRSSDNQFYFTLRARNGRVLMTSETYKRKEKAEKSMDAIRDMFAFTYVDVKDHTAKITKYVKVSPAMLEDTPSLNLTTERMVNGKLKPVRVTAGKKKGRGK
jgi:uncharacterized protein YegP (UPF0339 family)